ncbi:MAG TPA: hypothetical protein VHA52_05100 [Candidatus Babeliaceae bacterium]|jgi:hypothetical protein|nr:hypothetical protein [Candidatus Babeliaceae bacterium]
MYKVIFPNTALLKTETSILFPVKAFTAGTDVTIATIKTKRKVIGDLSVDGTNKIKMNPASGSKKAKESKTDSVIGIAYYLSVLFIFFPFFMLSL